MGNKPLSRLAGAALIDATFPSNGHEPDAHSSWSREVLRQRLLDRICEPSPAPITLIVAPAGYGKSTVARQWVAHHPRWSSGWYQIRTEHNSVTSFLGHLWRAIDSATSEEEEPHDISIERVRERLRRQSAPIALVLDDYHLIENETIHKFVGALLQDLPVSTHLFILSRQMPALPLARVRAYGHVRLLTQTELAFTFDEVKQVFAGDSIGDDLLLRLTQRSEGWIAGLQLALMSVNVQGVLASEQLERHIAAMPEGRLLNEFIVQEVLDSLPADLRRFICDTVVLDVLEPALCNAVLQIDSSARYLERLQNTIGFVGHSGVAGHPLTYHRLFAECVQRLRLREGTEPSAAELRLRAARWYHAQGDLETAAEYALSAEAWDEAASIIGEFIPRDLAYINVWDALYWVGRLPDSVLRQDMPLLQSYICTILANGRIDEARPLVDAFLRLPGVEPTPDQEGWLANMRAYIAFVDGDRDEALFQSYRALSRLPWEDASGRLLAWTGVYREKSARGEREIARAALRYAEVDRKRQQRESIYWHFLLVLDISNDAAIQGDLFGAEKLNRHFMQDLPPHMQVSLGSFKLRLLCIYLEQNRLELAAAQAEDILADIHEHNYLIWYSGALVAIARYYLAIGDPERARQTLDRSVRITRQHGGRELIRKAETGIAGYWLQTGQNELAQFWAGSIALDPHVIRSFGDVDPRTLHAQLLFRQHRYDEAMALLTESIALARDCGNVWAELSFQVWASVVARALGDHTGADAHLIRALELGAPGGFVRVYSSTDVDLSDAIRAVMPELSDTARSHARSLIGDLEPATSPGEEPAWEGAGLTPRESDVLAELVLGKSNREIADTLFISERTVKKHLASLFQKTGSASRTAVALWARDHLPGIGSAPPLAPDRTGNPHRQPLQFGGVRPGR